MPIKALMVDVDGVVIVHPDPKGWAVHLERDLGLAPQDLQEAFFRPHFAEVIHGRADLIERLAPVLAEIAPHLSAEILIDYWFRNDAHLDHTLLAEIAQARSEGIRAHLATVQEHRRADYLWRRLGLRNQFDAMHYAADLGWAKPAGAFFAAIEARTGFLPDEIFFIDDRAENVDAARERGWRGALWTGERRLPQLMTAASGP